MRTLEFARDTDQLIVADRDRVHVVDRSGASAPRELAIAGARALAAMGDELWVVAGGALQRIGSDVAIPVSGEGVLVKGAHLTWTGTPVLEAIGDGKVVDGDFALAVSPARIVIARRDAIALHDSRSVRWTVTPVRGGRVIDGAVLADGRSIALVIQRPDERSIVVLGMRDGVVQQRIGVAGTPEVRIAGKRGVATVVGDRRLTIVDLRFGRVIVEHELEVAIADHALDEAGQMLALRHEPFGEVHQLAVRDLLEAHVAAPVAVAVPVAVEPVREPDPEPVANPFESVARLVPVPALPARPPCEPTTAAETEQLLELQRELAIARVILAIASAWDAGRLAFPETATLPYRSEVEGLAGAQRGLASTELAAATQRLAVAREALARAEAAVAPRLSPLARLTRELGLSSLGRELLLVIAAPVLWGELARLYGILADDEHRGLCDEQLVVAILADHATRYAIAGELDSSGALIRCGAVRIVAGTVRPFLPLVADRVVLELLRGGEPTSELVPAVRPRLATVTLGNLRIRASVKDRCAGELARATGPLRLAVRGRVGSGRHTLIAAVAQASSYAIGVIDAARMAMADLALALERSWLAGLVPCITGIAPVGEPAARDALREVLRRHPGPIAMRLDWDAEIPLDPGHVAIDLPALSPTERLVAWEQTLAASRLHVAEIGALATRYSVGPGVIERVVAEVRGDGDEDSGHRLDAAIRQHLESRLGTTATRVTRLATWSQVILPADIQDSLTELIARIRQRRVVFDRWGFDRITSTARGVTALFQGGPGTGKTLVASAIANELGMDLYRVDLSRVMSKWIGETEQNLAKLFDAAEDGNAIILFDEADSLFAKRTEVRTSVDRYANLEVNYLLQRFDTFEGIAILTTNFGTSIDNAFKRRLSLRLTFPFPDEDQR
ncbi:MAG: ATP-binding protein, partial [Kofleriaceae bacterium]